LTSTIVGDWCVHLCVPGYFDKKKARGSQCWIAGVRKTLKLVLRMQAQVTFARDACNSSDNKSELAYM
jgi:hypothetical protein